ncbi:MAG: hypothetical protein IJM37_03485 [Lachnospiraceae bacterium]|nr:hypothetical protein [Lachnospiraceae bacterium]
MKRCYEIAGIRVTLDTEHDFHEYRFYDLFRVDDDALPDYYFKYTEVEKVEVDAGAKLIYSNARFDVYEKDGIEYRYYKAKSNESRSRYDAYIYLDGSRGSFLYTKEYDISKNLSTSLSILNNQVFEQMLLEHDAFVLHSSFIIYDGRAVIFSAPSGTGKSTQADLWEQHEGVTIVNGDRSIFKRENGDWHVYGIPMCGSSDICLNMSAPLEAVILLSQGRENNLKPADPKTALNKMFRECTVNIWNEHAVNKIFDLLGDIYEKAHVYTYSCTKEKDAVDVLKKELDSNRK